MYLSNLDEKILSGEFGEEKRVAMEILVALGEIYGAEKLVPVSSAQIAGVSFKSIGEAGLRWLESMRNARVTVTSTLNPAGMDLNKWSSMGVSRSFAEKQLKIIDCFKSMGVMISCTCTPYLAGNVPLYGQHVAWSESSSVCFANSVTGARTNREGGPSALASAIIGKTPLYGLHLSENRRANLRVKVEVDLNNSLDYGLLGYWTGKIVKTGIPYYTGLKKCDLDELKYLGASLAASSSSAMFHVEGFTPEYSFAISDKVEKASFDSKEYELSLEELSFLEERVDLVALGCPHLSLRELKLIAELVKGRRVRSGVKLWLFTSSSVKEVAERSGYVDLIEKTGASIYTDCCMIVSPIEELGFEVMATNSAKAAVYSPPLCKLKVLLKDLKDCLNLALID